MIHKTNIYKIEYEKYIFLKRIRILLFSMLVIISGVLCMKFFARAAIPSPHYNDEVLSYELHDDGTAVVIGRYNSSTVINIPQKIHPNEDTSGNTEYNVTEIYPNAFSSSNITEIHGYSIKTIGYNSFKSCQNLSTVDFPNATYIGTNIFDSCSRLQNISLPNAAYIGNSSFENCTSLKSASLPNANYIGEKVFANDSSLETIYIPNALYIGLHAFYYCSNLENIDLSNVSYLGWEVFGHCRKLKNIKIPNLVYCNLDTFRNCIYNSISLTLPNSIKEFPWSQVSNINYFSKNYTGKNATIALTIHESDIIDTELDRLKNKLSNEFFGEHGKIVYDFQTDRNYPIKSGSNSKYYAVEFRPSEKIVNSLTKFSTRVLLIKVLSNVNVNLLNRDGATFESTKYTGDEVEKPTFKITDGSYTLLEGVDYNLTYDSDFTNAGEKNILVDFIGDYSELSSIVKKFKILPIDASELTVSDIEFGYTGESHNLDSLEITYDGPKFITLEKGKDYIFLNTPDTKNAGEKKLYIFFKNNYSGIREVNIKINPKDASNFNPVCTNPHTYDGSVWNPEFYILDGNTHLVLGTDYDITSDSDMINAGTKNFQIVYKGNYYGSKDFTIDISQKDASSFDTICTNPHTYDGSVWNPEFYILDGNTHLVLGTDYDVTLDFDMINAGTKNLQIVYKGNYSGSKDFAIDISKKDASSFEPVCTNPHTYDGSTWNPELTILDGNTHLVLGTDYDITSDSDMINAGTKNLQIIYKGNYYGLKDFTIDISQKDASSFEPICTNPHTYDGLVWNPEFNILDGNTHLVLGTDYDISVAPDTDMINAGEKKLYISFKNNYKGTREVNIRINPKNASNFKIKYDETHFYDGKDWKPQFKTADGYNELILGKDYEVKLDKDMKEVGVKNVKIKYLGNYSGAKNIQLKIIIDKSSWGKEITSDGITNYVDDYGKTSAEVTGNKMIWLKESSDGSSAWYAVDNSNGVFRKGSRFWVKWLSPESDKEEFDKYYSQLDENQKNKVEESKLWIFLTGVTDPYGNDYSTLNTPIDYYVQIGDDWDKEDISAVFISDGKDENLDVSYTKIKFPEGNTEFAKISLIHFSPYAIFDELGDTPSQENENSNYPKNKENSRDLYLDKGQLIRSIINYNVNSGLISKISTWIFVALVSFLAFIILKKSK